MLNPATLANSAQSVADTAANTIELNNNKRNLVTIIVIAILVFIGSTVAGQYMGWLKCSPLGLPNYVMIDIVAGSVIFTLTLLRACI